VHRGEPTIVRPAGGQIAEVDQQRQAFIKEKLAAAGATEKDGFDKLVFASLKRQGAKCGLVYGEAK